MQPSLILSTLKKKVELLPVIQEKIADGEILPTYIRNQLPLISLHAFTASEKLVLGASAMWLLAPPPYTLY